ncbi:hypothetical protein NQZ68_014826 [Dissostichus eleginoides]|nr:hypothetical protein NQZ68_014826 [Dissostichus eleginoides]
MKSSRRNENRSELEVEHQSEKAGGVQKRRSTSSNGKTSSNFPSEFGVSSSRYSWKFDKNKDKSEPETKGYTFSKHGKSKCLTDSD